MKLFEIGDGNVSMGEYFWLINGWSSDELKMNRAEITNYHKNNLVVIEVKDYTYNDRGFESTKMIDAKQLKEYAFKDKDNAEANLVLLSLVE